MFSTFQSVHCIHSRERNIYPCDLELLRMTLTFECHPQIVSSLTRMPNILVKFHLGQQYLSGFRTHRQTHRPDRALNPDHYNARQQTRVISDLRLSESKRRGQLGPLRQTEVLSSLKPLGELLQLQAGVDRSRFSRLLLAAALHRCSGGRRRAT